MRKFAPTKISHYTVCVHAKSCMFLTVEFWSLTVCKNWHGKDWEKG